MYLRAAVPPPPPEPPADETEEKVALSPPDVYHSYQEQPLISGFGFRLRELAVLGQASNSFHGLRHTHTHTHTQTPVSSHLQFHLTYIGNLSIYADTHPLLLSLSHTHTRTHTNTYRPLVLLPREGRG